jgi:hypothetical protein
MEMNERLEQWVNERTAAADLPTEWPDLETGWTQLGRQTRRRRRHLLAWAGATAALCTAVFALPASRLAAQRLWDQVVMGRIQVVTTDYDGHGAAVGSFSPELQSRPEAHPMSSIDEATQVAGFAPHVPAAGVFQVSPTYSVTDMTSAKLQLRVPAIRALVQQAGGEPGLVPAGWDGVELEVRIGPVIIADYGGILLLQSIPFPLEKPADFDLELFYRIAFRALGMSEGDAHSLSADLGFSPALLMFMPQEDRELLHEFTTRHGTGMMIDEVYGRGKTLALWSSPDRIYALFPSEHNVSRELVITVANALD